MADDPQPLPEALIHAFKDYVLFQAYSLGHTHLDPEGPGLAIIMVAQEIKELRLSMEKKIDALIAATTPGPHA